MSLSSSSLLPAQALAQALQQRRIFHVYGFCQKTKREEHTNDALIADLFQRAIAPRASEQAVRDFVATWSSMHLTAIESQLKNLWYGVESNLLCWCVVLAQVAAAQ